MNKDRIIGCVFLLVLFIMALSSCESEGGCGESMQSSAGESESHNVGKNCVSCHSSGGSGEGCFSAAGTVYDSTLINTNNNATIKLYSQPNAGGTVVATLTADQLGNFYDTQNYDFSKGVYPSVTGAKGTKHMGTMITTASCNSCHGVSTSKLWAR